MPSNWWMFLIAGLIPMVLGSVWYNPKVMGNKWMKINGFSEDYLKEGNMGVIFGVSYLFCCMIAFALMNVVVHQGGFFGSTFPEVMEAGSQAQLDVKMMLERYGENSRTFGHGVLHGVIFAITVALPLIGVVALFERRGWSYIFIHWFYWLICIALMGGLLCATLTWDMPF